MKMDDEKARRIARQNVQLLLSLRYEHAYIAMRAFDECALASTIAYEIVATCYTTFRDARMVRTSTFEAFKHLGLIARDIDNDAHWIGTDAIATFTRTVRSLTNGETR